jgi:nucleotide-binding universal stress UspA family protein
MTAASSHPLIICYDGSSHAKHAIDYAARMFPGGFALVVTVWQPTAGLGSLAWAGALDSMGGYVQMDRSAAENAGRIAQEGVEIARRAGLGAKPLAVESAGPIWKTIVDIASTHQGTMIVMGSRGHSSFASILLGSVSNAVLHHADRPTLVIPARENEEVQELASRTAA